MLDASEAEAEAGKPLYRQLGDLQAARRSTGSSALYRQLTRRACILQSETRIVS